MAEIAGGAVNLLAALSPAAAVAAIAVPLAGWVRRALPPRFGFAWTLLWLPYFTPPILIGYAWAQLRIAGPAWEAKTWSVYLAVLVVRLTPVAALIFYLIPAPASAAGGLGFSMMARASLFSRYRFRIEALGRAPWIAFSLVFLLAFSDFELAAMWNVRTWTVALFDAHAGGLPLSESFHLAAPAAALEVALLTALFFSFSGINPSGTSSLETTRMAHPLRLGYLFLAATILSIVPAWRLSSDAAGGLRTLLETFSFGSDLLASFVFAGLSGLAAWWCSSLADGKRLLCLALSAPGLLGALVISLAVLALFQTPVLRPLYDTPFPLLLALTFLLLPAALVLRLLIGRGDAAWHIASQRQLRALLWEISGRTRFLAAAVLFCIAYFDFTASSLLAPVGFTPVFVRLHNLMHYGRNAALSAMTLAAFALPLLVLLLTGATAQLYARRDGR